jgi:2,4-diaminopentanoate dehydrogenase
VSTQQVRLAIYGFGRVGPAALELALTRPWLRPVAVVVRSPEREGRSAAETVATAPPGLRLSADPERTLADARPDVVIVATRSRLDDVLPHLRVAAGSGARAIVCTAEELAYVRPGDGPAARAIHTLAAERGVAILAAGVNPGFVLDLVPLVLTGAAWDVQRIEAVRVVDVSVFAPEARARLGVGHTPDAFEQGVRDGTVMGHVGFHESLRLLTAAMGRPAARTSVETTPVVAERDHRLPEGTVPAGLTVGARQRAVAWLDGQPWVSIEMLLHAAPGEAGITTRDEVTLDGRHAMRLVAEPGFGAMQATAALLVNSIPRALAAAPGVYGPGDLPPPVPWLAATPPPPDGVALAATEEARLSERPPRRPGVAQNPVSAR